MPWERYKFPEGCISWAHRPITAYIYTVDREFDFDKKVAFFDAHWKKNKNYKGRVTHTVHFDDNGKIDIKEANDTEVKDKRPKEHKLPKVNDFIDLVGGSTNKTARLRDSSSSTSSNNKIAKSKPQPAENSAATPKRKFRRRGKTPFLTDREGDDYICLTCKAKDRQPWRFKMSQQIAAHVRLHNFNSYKFDDGDEEDGEEEDKNSNNTNVKPDLPLIDISNEKSATTKNGAEAEFAALISLMSISQSSAMQIDTAPVEPILEPNPVKDEKSNTESAPARSKKPGELNMRSRLTDSLNINPVEIQRTLSRLEEKETSNARSEATKLAPKVKNSGNTKEGTEEKKKTEKPSQTQTIKDKSTNLESTASNTNDPSAASQPVIKPASKCKCHFSHAAYYNIFTHHSQIFSLKGSHSK